MNQADDLIIDVLQKVQRTLGLNGQDARFRAVESEVRQQWKGVSYYVTSSAKRDRNANILHDWQQGMTTNRLAARYHLTDRRVRQIVKRSRG